MISLVIIILAVFLCFAIFALSPEVLWSLRTPFICISWLPTGIAVLVMRARALAEATMGYGLLLGLLASVLTGLILSFLGIRLLIKANRDGKPRKLLAVSTILAVLPLVLAVVSLFVKRFISFGNA